MWLWQRPVFVIGRGAVCYVPRCANLGAFYMLQMYDYFTDNANNYFAMSINCCTFAVLEYSIIRHFSLLQVTGV